MKRFRLNNKGMTTVEILISFVIVATISASLYTVIDSYSEMTEIEQNKLQVSTFRNTFTKTIENDFVKNGLISAINRDPKSESLCASYANCTVVDYTFQDGSGKRLIIGVNNADSYIVKEKEAYKYVNDEFFLSYDGEIFEFPDIGYGYNHLPIGNDSSVKTPVGQPCQQDKRCIIKDLRITGVDSTITENVYSLFIGVEHIDLGRRYSINIVCPLNYNQ